jgi:hypothetical protein
MATGRSNSLTRQIGEHLAAAELGRRDYLATPFAGNIPMFDLLVADHNGYAIPIQVKAIKGPSWQFNVDRFLRIQIDDEVQKILGTTKLPYPKLVCMFIFLKEYGKDEFYIFHLQELQKFFRRNYKEGRRPNNPQSRHCAIWPRHLKKFRDNWELIEQSLAFERARLKA